MFIISQISTPPSLSQSLENMNLTLFVFPQFISNTVLRKYEDLGVSYIILIVFYPL